MVELDQDRRNSDDLRLLQMGASLSAESRLSRFTRISVDYPLTTFFVLAYWCSWSVFLPMIFLHLPIQLTILASFGPTAAALITHRLATGNYRAFRLYSTGLQTLLASIVGYAIVVLAYAVLPAAITADPRKLRWNILTSVGAYNYSTLLGGPLGEEPGWRGYALPRLEARFGPVRASALIALLWAGWHLPLFLVPGWTSSPLWMYVLTLTGLCVIMTYGANLGGFGVITAIAMHAAFNMVSSFLNSLFTDTQPGVSIPFELVMALSGLGTALVLVVLTRGRLAYPEAQH